MLIEKLISPLVPTLLPTDTGNTALHIMEENNFTQLPIVSDQQYLALINENEVMDWNTPESPLSASAMMQYRPAVFAKGHPYEALRIAHEYNLSIVPVIDEQNIYIGSITKDELLKYLPGQNNLVKIYYTKTTRGLQYLIYQNKAIGLVWLF